MTKFKSGDKVERTWVVGDLTAQFTGIERWGIYTVDIVCGDCISLVESFQPGFTFSSERFELAEEQDDPLPPAPESVLYIGMQDYYRALRVGRHDGGGVLDLHIGGGVLGDGKSCILDPDSALQLAHDLNRMANEIKRKEKKNA